jgi:hypothetical protein
MLWQDRYDKTPEGKRSQKEWDNIACESKVSQLLASPLIDDVCKAGVLAGRRPHSGAWITALPVAPLGLKLSDDEVRIAAALRIGAKVCEEHQCICGSRVGDRGTHGLSCNRLSGRRQRHTHLNHVISRALQTAQHPNVLEPPGLNREDNKRPDGMTLVPWEEGRSLLWDVTCVDTLAPCHLGHTSKNGGWAAEDAGKRKHAKYAQLKEKYFFVPIALETLGPWGVESERFVRALGKKMEKCTGEVNSVQYLGQSISIAIQRGNAACIQGTFKSTDECRVDLDVLWMAGGDS